MEAVETASDTGPAFDLDAAADRIGDSLFPEHEVDTDDVPDQPVAESVAAQPEPVLTPTTRQVPKSWPKEMHDYWGKTDPKVQEYWETREQQMLTGLDQYKTDAQLAKQFRDSLTPYQQTLKQLNLDPVTAAKHLFQADHTLRYSPPDQRLAYFKELAKTYGVDLGTVQAAAEAAPVDPTVKALQEQMHQIQSGLTARQQQDYETLQANTSKEVETFASDPLHPHFNDVADDIVLLLKTGLPLQEAYDKAVWANPLTREKELQARLLTETEKQKENARLTALPKAKAVRNNVQSVESKRTPTEPLGTMKDTMLETLKEIRARAS